MLDLLIRGGTLVFRDSVLQADLGIKDGVIVGIYADSGRVEAKEIQSAAGLHILPGVVDPHGHLTPGDHQLSESCEIMSRQMAAGGTTSFIDFTNRTGDYIPALQQVKETIAKYSIIDMGSNPMIMHQRHIESIPHLIEEHRIAAIKMFPAGLAKELYKNQFSVDDGTLWLAMREAARQNPQLLVRVHAENWEIAWALEPEVRAAGRTDPGAWTDVRPHLCEEETVRRVAFLAGKAGCPVYCVHLTTAAAPEIILESWSKGVRLYGETCPQYLTLHRDHPKAMLGKYQPSIKTREDVEALWKALKMGVIHCIGSDHLPVTGENKFGGGPDIWSAVGGAPTGGTILPVLLNYGYQEGRLTLPDIARVSSYNPARILRLPHKGALRVGADADLVLVDLKKTVTLDPALLHVEFTFYDGEKFTGWPVQTFVRGRCVMIDGNIVSSPGGGRYLSASLEQPIGVL